MRIDKIINDRKPPTNGPKNLDQLYEWLKTPEGKAETDKWYDPNRNQVCPCE